MSVQTRAFSSRSGKQKVLETLSLGDGLGTLQIRWQYSPDGDEDAIRGAEVRRVSCVRTINGAIANTDSHVPRSLTRLTCPKDRRYSRCLQQCGGNWPRHKALGLVLTYQSICRCLSLCFGMSWHTAPTRMVMSKGQRMTASEIATVGSRSKSLWAFSRRYTCVSVLGHAAFALGSRGLVPVDYAGQGNSARFVLENGRQW